MEENDVKYSSNPPLSNRPAVLEAMAREVGSPAVAQVCVGPSHSSCQVVVPQPSNHNSLKPSSTPVISGPVASMSNNNQFNPQNGDHSYVSMTRKKVCLKPPPSSLVIFTRFYNFSGMGKRKMRKGTKRVNLYEAATFNPFQATIQQVADFFFYLELTEVVTLEHQKACIASLSKYLPDLEPEMRAGAAVGDEGFMTFLSKFRPGFMFREGHQHLLDILPKSLNWYQGYEDKPWPKFSEFCKRKNLDPFLASPELVSDFIRQVVFAPEHKDFDLLFPKYNFYSNNIKYLCQKLERVLSGSVEPTFGLHQHHSIQQLMLAAVAVEEKILSNEMALDLLPQHHYVHVRLTTSEDDFWSGSFVLDVFRDVRKNVLPLSVAALELGVSSEMLFSAMMKKGKQTGETLPSMGEFLQRRNASAEKYWSDPRVVKMLEDVRNRISSVSSIAFKLGVSRGDILAVCGNIKTQEELEAEKAQDQIRKIKEKEEAATKNKKPTQLEKQIRMAEEEEEELSEYEKHRLDNLRERMELLEKLNFEEDKKEIRIQTKLIRKSTPKEKVVVELREKSVRVQRKLEQERLKASSKWSARRVNQSGRESPLWLGKTVPINLSEDKVVASNPVPKFDLLATQLLEMSSDYRASSVFLDSLSEEEVQPRPVENQLSCTVDWARGLEVVGETIVSSSPVTGLDSRGDLVCYGTEEGGVGVLLEGRSVTIRPHNQAVTAVRFRSREDGRGVMSSSQDGTVRLYDLARETVQLEYSWDQTETSPSGVRAMAKTGEDTFLLQSGRCIVSVDLRMRKSTSLLKLEGFQDQGEMASLEVHPNDAQIVSVSQGTQTQILDLRQAGQSRDLLWRSFSAREVKYSGWSQTGKYYCILTEGRPGTEVYDAGHGQPTLIPRGPEFNDRMRSVGGEAGSPWCPWEENLLASIYDSKLQLVDCQSGLLKHNLKVPVSRPVIFHCHQTRPLVILGNLESDGRLRILSANL